MIIRKTPEALRLKADILEENETPKTHKTHEREDRMYTVSHRIMFGIMIMYFFGVGLGIWVTVKNGVDVQITLDFIMQLAKIVSLGYFVKAFGENIAKIVLSAIFGSKFTDSNSKGSSSG